MMLRQLHFSELDLVLHSRYTPAEGRTVFDSEEVKAVEARTTVLPPLPEDRSAPESHADTCWTSCLLLLLLRSAAGSRQHLAGRLEGLVLDF